MYKVVRYYETAWEKKRRVQLAILRADLEPKVGQCWDVDELQRDFKIDQFAGGIAFGWRRSDGAKVSLDFYGSPRLYFGVQLSDFRPLGKGL